MHLYAKRLGWIGISRMLGFRVPGVLSYIYCCSICACVGAHECVRVCVCMCALHTVVRPHIKVRYLLPILLTQLIHGYAFVYVLYCVYKYIHLYVHIWRAEMASLVARHRKEV